MTQPGLARWFGELGDGWLGPIPLSERALGWLGFTTHIDHAKKRTLKKTAARPRPRCESRERNAARELKRAAKSLEGCENVVRLK